MGILQNSNIKRDRCVLCVNLYLRRVREPIFNLNAHGIVQKSQHQIENTKAAVAEIVATFICSRVLLLHIFLN